MPRIWKGLDMKPLFCIIGRSGSGKTTLEKNLCKYGLTSVKSYTTRPKRTPDEDNHTFISEETYLENEWDMVAYTFINGYHYFATREQTDLADIYVIDPRGFNELVLKYPERLLVVCYLSVDKQQLEKQLQERAKITNETEEHQQSRLNDEDSQFTEFEKQLQIRNFPPNVFIL